MFFNLGCRPTTTRLHFDFLSCWVWYWSREIYEGYLFFRLKDYTSNQWEILIVCWSNCTFIFFCFSKNGKVDLLFTENFNLSLLKIIACLFSFLSYNQVDLGQDVPISTLSRLLKIIFILILLKKLNKTWWGGMGMQIFHTHPTLSYLTLFWNFLKFF